MENSGNEIVEFPLYYVFFSCATHRRYEKEEMGLRHWIQIICALMQSN